MPKTVYINSMGTFSRKGNTLHFSGEGKQKTFPVEEVQEIFFLSEISLNTKLLSFLKQKGIIAHFFDYYENYSGTFFPEDRKLSGKILIKQVEAISRREIVAKAIVQGILENMHEVLYHYKRHGKEEISDVLNWMKKEAKDRLNKATTIPEIMGVEGQIWERFYGSFQYFLPEEFTFNKRVKRPPDNPMNGLISLGNSILYAKTKAEIYKTPLDQRISFLHEPMERRFSLSLDLSEVFKPVIVSRTIFDLVNNRKLKVEKHFLKEVNYANLNKEGKIIFENALEERIESTFSHPRLKRRVSYRNAIKLDAIKLMKFILQEKESFCPFSLKRGE